MTTVHLDDGAGGSLRVLEVGGRYFPAFPVETLQTYRQLPLRPDDVILCAYPKSGTHWVWEVCMMLLGGQAVTVPFKKSLQMLEFASASSLALQPTPRVLNTHVHHAALPSDALAPDTPARLVLVLRNPKDVAVSYYNHHRKLHQYYQYEGEFCDWLNLFREGRVDYGSWFDYVKSWDRVIKSDVANPIHVIMYEDMKEDPVRETRRLAEFLGVTPDPQLMEAVAAKCEFSKMAEDKKPVQEHSEIMFRKGVVGDWKNTMTVAQSEALDELFRTEMADCVFNFRFTL